MEDEKKEEIKTEEVIEDADEKIINEAKKAANEQMTANAIKLKILEKEEKLIARKEALAALGGNSIAGFRTPEEDERMKKKKGAMDFWKGSGIDQAIERYG